MYAGSSRRRRPQHVRAVVVRHDVRHEELAVLDDHRSIDAVQLGERRLHLSKLHSVPANLHLMIDAAEVFQLSARVPPDPIARLVDALAPKVEEALGR